MDAWQAALAQAHRHGSLLAKACVSWGLGFTHARRGELVDAELWLRTARDEFAQWGLGPAPGEINCVSLLAPVLVERGQLIEARRELDCLADPGDSSDSARYWLSAQLELLLAEGALERALTVADDLARRFAYLDNPVDTPWRSHKALALDALGRPRPALRLAHEDLALARAWGAPGSLARSLRVLGMLERESGIEHLQQAVAAASGSPARLEHAKALAALGRGLRGARRAAEARAPLNEAIELAERSGALRLIEHARSELYAAGGRPRAGARRRAEVLTASELRVARLAGHGQTSREIAQALFVTPKTVEMHLGNAYRKLGIRSRHQLSAALEGRADA
jgi:DNA-binding CsgD family transcriptional regulator